MRRLLFFVLAGVVSLSVMAFAGGSRGPITILAKGDFTAENGVVSGKGTAKDPYIIAGWEIDVPYGELYGVRIEDVNVRFVLRGLIIRGALATDGAAVRLGSVAKATVEGCTVVASENGIEIVSSTDVTLTGNILTVSGMGLRLVGESADEYRHTIDESNLLNGFPISYLYGKHDEAVSGIHSNNLYVAVCRRMTIEGNEIIDGDGIQLAFVDDSLVKGNVVRRLHPVETEQGIRLYRSTGNVLSENVLINNRRAGIYLWLSSENRIEGNQLYANDTGIHLAGSDDNSITGNALAANPTGIAMIAGSTGNDVAKNIVYHENTKQGIVLARAPENRIAENVILDSETGIFLDDQANNNKVLANSIIGGAYGMLMVGSYNEVANNFIAKNVDGILFRPTFGQSVSRGNAFHDNVFSQNSRRHVSLTDDSQDNCFSRNFFLGEAVNNARIYDPGRNVWTVNDEGNYWGDYAGTDSDGDGIGDEPVLVVPAGVEDTAPLISVAGATDGLGVLTTLERKSLTLLTKEKETIVVDALIADADHSRFVGFSAFPGVLLEDFPGILFVYDQEVEGGPTGAAFTMKRVDFDLGIAFFDATGLFVGGATMTANSDVRYTVNGLFQYALELPNETLGGPEIGEGTQLVLPPGEG
jgi:parallel beta-helix repeat protein